MTQQSVRRVPMKGRDLQRSIIGLANRLGWLCATFPPVQTDRGWRTAVGAQGKGWPDIALVRDRMICAEVKGDSDRLRPDQQKWQDALALAGVPVYVWTSAGWYDGSIEEILRSRAS